MSTHVDSYTKTDIAGQTYQYNIYQDPWKVDCWKKVSEDETEIIPGSTSESEWEHMWEVRGVVTGYVDGNPNRQITEPFTEETARKEFERWRT